MNFLSNVVSQEIVSSLGWTLIHSLWQGALVAVMLASLLVILRKTESRIRSLVSIGALIIFLALTVRTFVDTYNNSNNNIPQDFVLVQEGNSSSQQSQNVQPAKEVAKTESLADNLYLLLGGMGNYFKQNLAIIVTVWLMGVLLLTLKLIGGFAYSQRLKNYKTFPVSDKWVNKFNSLCKKIDLTRPVKFAESAIIKAPLAIGYLKPVVLLPLGTLTGLPASQVEAILVHELAHIVRADYLINILQSIIETIFFYHPAVWWISSTIRKERENCCDDIAVEVTGDSFTYAKALVNVQAFGVGESGLAMAAIGKNEKLFRRINRMILKQKTTGLGGKLGAAAILLVSLFAATLISCSSLNNDEFSRSHKQFRHLEKIEDFTKYDEGEKTLSFYEREKGEKIHWEVSLVDGEITELYKDGKKIPDEEIYKYKNKIDKKLADISEDMQTLEEELAEMDLDLSGLDEELATLKEELKDLEIDEDNFHWNSGSHRSHSRESERSRESGRVRVDFDSESLRENLRELREGLADLKINFDDNDFEVDSDFDFDFDFDHDFEGKVSLDFDSDKFHADMEDLHESLASMRVDLSDLDIDIDIPEIKLDMTKLNKELAKLKGFLNELKTELVEDGLIDDVDQRFDFEYEDGSVYIDGDKISDELTEKYKDIYEKHFDEELDDESNFRIN